MTTTDNMKEIAYKLHNINKKVLKSNLKQIINEKYNKKGWRKEVADMLNMNLNTFNGMINQANISSINLEKLIHTVSVLELDINKVFANNKVIKSNQGRVDKKWTKDMKYQFVLDYMNNDINYVAKKYEVGTGTVITYYNEFKKKVKIL